jgi:quinol-cytochrome oxidoreductase complex cytochrome b subunit
MISGIVLIFAAPMIIAALLISPTAVHNLIHGLPLYAVLGVVLPIVGWRTFLVEFAFPTAADTRLAAVIRVWVVGTVMVAAVFNLLMAVLDYSPARPGPNPTAGFLLGGFVLCTFVSSGIWGGLSPVLPPDVVIGGALVTGAFLFIVVATLGFLVSR